MMVIWQASLYIFSISKYEPDIKSFCPISGGQPGITFVIGGLIIWPP
jgi:hypothetical protein